MTYHKTDVEDGDFALHVSGDSMEPDIPNGSTAFVKKQSEIADGIKGFTKNILVLLKLRAFNHFGVRRNKNVS